MKGIDLLCRRVVFSHMLAIALAGIISLLFAQTSYVFLNTSVKKLEYRSVATDCVVDGNCANQFFLAQADYNLCSQAEEINLIQVNAAGISVRQFLKVIFQARVYEQRVKVKKIFYLNKYLQFVRPSNASPTIPIAFCKLII